MKFFALILLSLSFHAAAWGPTGHRVVGEVATKFLTPQSLAKIHTLLDGQSLSRVANWSDEIKSEPLKYQYTFSWHFTDWSDEIDTHDETTSSGILLTSIRDQLKILKDPASDKAAKVFALKFVTHLVGDVHMPLHVGNGQDQGGNYCKVSFQGKPMSLHVVWDEAMIDFTHLSFTELAKFIAQGKTAAQVNLWSQGDLIDWARESKQIRMSLYPQNVPLKQYCGKDIVVPEADLPKLSYEYSYKFVPVVEQRLYQAGLRLALLLNQVL